MAKGKWIVFLLVVSLSASLLGEEKNLLLNGDFEGANPAPWEKRTPDDKDRALSIMPEAAHAGKWGARIINHRPVVSRWRQGADGRLSVPAGTTVRLAGWIRTELGPEGYAALRLYCMSPPERIVAQPQTRPVAGKSDWKRVSLTTTIPEGTTSLMVYLELANACGTADYDDLSLTVMAPPEPRVARNDLLLLSDAPVDDPSVHSLNVLYPGRMVRIQPGGPATTLRAALSVPKGGKVNWEGYRGAVLLARSTEAPFDPNSVEQFVAKGNPAVVDLAIYAHWRGLQVRETVGTDVPTLNIVREHRVTKGFRPGDSIPWYAGEKNRWKQRSLQGHIRGQVLGESSRGGALLVAEDLGKGILLATDLTALAEPAYNLPGAFNKYLFLGNLLSESARYGQHYPRRLSYEEFVGTMRGAATSAPALRFQEEGPAYGAYRIYSLNMGDPQKPAFLLYAVAHGSEWEPAYGLLTLARALATRSSEKLLDMQRYSLKIIPILNPSGYDRKTRQNAAGVDLNRNAGEWWETFRGKDSNKDGVWAASDYDWKGPAPFSEAETQTFRAICERVKLHAVLEFHGNAGGRGNNRLIILPLVARDENEERAYAAVRDFNRTIRDRYVLLEATRPGVEQYEIEAVHCDSQRPTLIETACKGRLGFLCEVPAGYSGTYGLVFQTDVVVETCLAFFRAYQ